MAIQQTKKQSDLEKRLRLLRQQVHGRTPAASSGYHVQSNHSPQTTNHSDTAYLYQDLLKIGTFASIAIGIQVILFFLIQNHILNLKLF